MEDKATGKNMKPLFKLERYFITRTSCTATPGYSKAQRQDGRVEVKANILNHQEDPSRWRIDLEIGLSEQMNKAFVPYDFSLHLVGFFLCPRTKELPEEEVKKIVPLIYVQGASLLYALATEYLRNITSAGPYGPYLLPSYTFVPSGLKAGRSNPKMFFVGKGPYGPGMVN
ncbi:MAG: hypothetical protein JW971_00460 [Synergistales bacterium]|nr:hypothetical protein [Synergistales bacterium]